MIERRELIAGVLLTGLFRGNALAAGAAPAASDNPKTFDDVHTVAPPKLIERIQACMDDIYAEMDKSKRNFGSKVDGSINCQISAFGSVTVNAGGTAGKLTIDMSPDGSGQVTMRQGNAAPEDISDKPMGQVFKDGIKDEFEKRSKAGAAPGW